MSVDSEAIAPVPVATLPSDLPELIRPGECIPEGPVRKAIVSMVDDDFTIGLMYRRGNNLYVRGFVETRKIPLSKVSRVEYLPY